MFSIEKDVDPRTIKDRDQRIAYHTARVQVEEPAYNTLDNLRGKTSDGLGFQLLTIRRRMEAIEKLVAYLESPEYVEQRARLEDFVESLKQMRRLRGRLYAEGLRGAGRTVDDRALHELALAEADLREQAQEVESAIVCTVRGFKVVAASGIGGTI